MNQIDNYDKINETQKSDLKINFRFFCFLFFILNFISVITIIYFSYYVSKIVVLKDTDNKLLAAAYACAFTLGGELHDSIENGLTISKDQHNENTLILTELARKCRVDYIYTAVLDSGEVFLTSSSVSEEDIKKKDFMEFYIKYKEPGESLLKSFNDSRIYFEEVMDEYGHFRTVIIPMKSKNGKKYIAAADILMHNISARLNTILTAFIFAGAFILAVTSAAFIYLIRKV